MEEAQHEPVMVVRPPIRTRTERTVAATARSHWSVKAKSTADVRTIVAHKCLLLINEPLGRVRVDVEWVVNTRHRRDTDNLAPFLKAIYDGIGADRGLSARIVLDDDPSHMEKVGATIRYDKTALAQSATSRQHAGDDRGSSDRGGRDAPTDADGRDERWGVAGLVGGPQGPREGDEGERQWDGNAVTDSAAPTQAWGSYAAAITRWEARLGRRAPHPTRPDGKNGAHRLNPEFVEWMMGLPEGWLTAPEVGLTRAQQLKALGNGVVPQQAALAVRTLLDAEAVAA
jgi:hypothetical protein